jgi:hypothetical protein
MNPVTVVYSVNDMADSWDRTHEIVWICTIYCYNIISFKREQKPESDGFIFNNGDGSALSGVFILSAPLPLWLQLFQIASPKPRTRDS